MKSTTATLSTPTSASSTSARTHRDEPGARPHPRAHQRIRVLLADDHPVVRRGIVACLERSPNVEIVGEAADGAEALSKAKELAPDVLLTDNDMPHLTGLAVTEALRKQLPKVKVLIVSLQSEPEYVLRCAQAGAKGYVFKQAPPDEFILAVETVSAGRTFFAPDVARAAVSRMVRGNGAGPDLSHLSNREREVLLHIADGLYNKEIASRLKIGTRTVETHRQRLMTKLGIHSIAGLTRFAVAKGLVPGAEPAMA